MKILFYSDVQQTGGHEIMAIEAIKSLLPFYDIDIIISKYNDDLCKRLSYIMDNRKIHQINYFSNRFQIIRNVFSFKTKKELDNLISKIMPDIVIGIQGTIDSSFLIFPICKKRNIKNISYIPISFDLRKISKNKYIGLLKDIIHRFYYKYPDIFITINEILAERIKRKSQNNSVFIIKNGVDFSKYFKYDKIQCRNDFNISINKYVIGYIGRIELWHKGLDYYIDFLNKNANKYPDVLFLFVGSGNGEPELQELIHLTSNVLFLPWVSDVSKIYSLIDCYIIPSRFESGPGCPLTMLEALHFGIPVIASNIPEISCFLPKENLYDIGNYEQMQNKINDALNDRLKNISLKENEFSIQQFYSTFKDCISKIMKEDA